MTKFHSIFFNTARTPTGQCGVICISVDLQQIYPGVLLFTFSFEPLLFFLSGRAWWLSCLLYFVSETHRAGQMDDKTWLLGNINQTGYFRVNYDLQNWKLLIQQLHTNPQVCLCLLLTVFLTSCLSVCMVVSVSVVCLTLFLCLSDHLRWKQGGTYWWCLQPGQVSLLLTRMKCWFSLIYNPLFKELLLAFHTYTQWNGQFLITE